jgi:divalent metal cation (Fe/Co/Zn/Cd) transporter
MNRQGNIERKALLVGAFIYLILGLSGWYTYYSSNSEAMLLDANYNMVNSFASFIGFYVVKIRSKKTATFPWGQFIYESLYALVKGILILGILIAALWENSMKIYAYFLKGKTLVVNTGPILPMIIISVVLSFGLAIYYKSSNKKIENNSTMLTTDTKAAMIDGYLFFFGGGSLLLMLYLGKIIPSLRFLQFIGDALVVLIFEAVMIKEPIHIIKNNFVELAGGQLQSDSEWKEIKDIVTNTPIRHFTISNVYIIKTGSSILILVYISQNSASSFIKRDDIIQFKASNITQLTKMGYPNVAMELIIQG